MTQAIEPRVVLITGGANGIGWAASQRFAAAGDIVVIADRNGEAAQEKAAALGGQAVGLRADVSSEDDVKAMIAVCADRFGRIDVLINNAGIIDAAGAPLVDQPVEAFRNLINVNVMGAYFAAREAGRLMLAQGRGAIVNLASGAGLVAVPYRNGYGASKAAIASLTRNLACEWGSHGIRVNAVAPGYTRTEMVQQLIDGGKVNTASVDQRIPLGRMATSEEIAEGVFYLASDEASFVTGALLLVDGGMLAYGGTGSVPEVNPAPSRPAAGPRTVLVTGAASGIGLCIARAFLADGCRVGLLDRNAGALAEAQQSLGGDTLAWAASVTDEAAVEAAAAEMVERWGRIDVLINNAGVADVFAPTVDQRTRDVMRVLDVDLTGVFVVSKMVGRHMLAQGGGAVVNLASIAGIAALPPRNAYCAAKAGVIMLTRNMACEWAQGAVRVNAVAPGYIETPGLMALEREGVREFGAVRRRTPMGRLGKPEEIADAVRFLASDAASYITGAVLGVDGGWSAYGDAGDASAG